jgi:single-strand DNA-binding protein
VNAYKGNDGEAKATLTFHVNTIKLHGNGKKLVRDMAKVVPMAAVVTEPAEDVPF